MNWLLWCGRVHCRRDRPCQCGQRGHCAAFLSTSANFVDLYSYKSPITFRSPWPEQAPRRTVQRAPRAPSRRGRRADLPLPMSLPPEPPDPTCTRTILPLAPISTRFRLAGAGAGCYCPVPYPGRRAAAERAAPHTTCAIKTKTDATPSHRAQGPRDAPSMTYWAEQLLFHGSRQRGMHVRSLAEIRNSAAAAGRPPPRSLPQTPKEGPAARRRITPDPVGGFFK